MRQKMSGRPPQPEKAEAGGPFFIFCILEVLALDNPRTAVYNKNKERRYPCKRLAPHQSSITKVMTATGLGVLGGHFFLCFFLCILVLDNPRTAVYNKDKERRYPCKRLAPHQFKSLQKVMTATELGNCGRSFLFVLFPFAAIRIILFPVVHQMYNTYEKCQQCDDRLEKQ